MKKVNFFTQLKQLNFLSISKLVLPLLLVAMWASNATAQCSIACGKPYVSVVNKPETGSLTSCYAVLLPEQLLLQDGSSAISGCVDLWQIRIQKGTRILAESNPAGVPHNQAFFFNRLDLGGSILAGYTNKNLDVSAYLDQDLMYSIININTGVAVNNCMSTIKFQDKTAPEFGYVDQYVLPCYLYEEFKGSISATPKVVFNNLPFETKVDVDFNTNIAGDQAIPGEPVFTDENTADTDYYDFPSTTVTTFPVVGNEKTFNLCHNVNNPNFFVADNCKYLKLSYSDRVETLDCRYEIDGMRYTCRIVRTWEAIDMAGNKSTATTTFLFKAIDVSEITLPAQADVDCADANIATKDANGNPAPSAVGAPYIKYTCTINGVEETKTYPLKLTEDGVCNFKVGYADVTVPFSSTTKGQNCTGTRIIRDWTIIDWCTNVTRSEKQIITIADTKGPKITRCPGAVELITSSKGCSFTGVVGAPQMTDNCDPSPRLEIEFFKITVTSVATGLEVDPLTISLLDLQNATKYTITADASESYAFSSTSATDVPVGAYYIKYTAIDRCDNIDVSNGVCYQLVKVVDKTPPIPVCLNNVKAGITLGGLSCIYPKNLDGGSIDNCCLDEKWFKVKRMGEADSRFRDSIMFNCADQNVQVILQVADCYGNKNSCMVTVTVENKVQPTITCPGDLTIDCFDSTDPISTGRATTIATCGTVPTPTYTDKISNDNGCGEKLITRTWKIPGTEITCDQKIQVRNTHHLLTFAHEKHPKAKTAHIVFPKDTMITKCAGKDIPDPAQTGRTKINYNGCDVYASSYKDLILTQEADACKKILRTWVVVDWCYYKNNGQDPHTIYWNTDKIDTAVDYDDLPTTSILFREEFRPTYFDESKDAGYAFGYWTYTQVIKIVDKEAPVISSDCTDKTICVMRDDCTTGDVSLGATAYDNCTSSANLHWNYIITLNNGRRIYSYNDADNSLTNSTVSNKSKAVTDAMGTGFTFPFGKHHISWVVNDGCGNTDACDYYFEIKDCKKPTPIAKTAITTTLMPNTMMVSIPAKDFDNDIRGGSYDNCTAKADLKFRVQKVPGCDGNAAAASINTTAKVLALPETVTFDCADTKGGACVNFYVVDAAGNYDYVTVMVAVQNNMGTPCPATAGAQASIAGLISTEMGESVEAVTVKVNESPTITGISGIFNFASLVSGATYTVKPEKDMEYMNGISTSDLVQISRHILGQSTITSPYKLIAADVNKSGSVSISDIIELRKMILKINDKFTNNTSWRFVAKNYQFKDASNPFAETFPEVATLSGLNTLAQTDFVAIKIGDVNISAVPNSSITTSRSAKGDLTVTTEDKTFKAGEEVNVTLSSETLNSIEGFQFTLNYDKNALELSNIAAKMNNMSKDNFALLEQGTLTTSWNGATNNQGDLFTVTFIAKKDGSLSDMMSINSTSIAAEAYNNAGENLNINLKFNGRAIANENFELFQNQPNPFSNETKISFNLAKEDNATLSIYDAAGRLLKSFNGNFAKGRNEIYLNKADINAKGVLYYRLETSSNVATKKMIIMD